MKKCLKNWLAALVLLCTAAAAHAQSLALHDQINAARREAARLRNATTGLTGLKAEVAALKSKAVLFLCSSPP